MMFDSTRSVRTPHNGRETVVKVSAEVRLTPAQRDALALVAAVAALRASLPATLPEWRLPWARVGVRTVVTESAIGGVYEISTQAARALEGKGVVRLAPHGMGGAFGVKAAELTELGREVAAELPGDVAAIALKTDGYLPAGARS